MDLDHLKTITEEERKKHWEYLNEYLWADFVIKLDNLCKILEESGVRD